jgi:hypothetical protein
MDWSKTDSWGNIKRRKTNQQNAKMISKKSPLNGTRHKQLRKQTARTGTSHDRKHYKKRQISFITIIIWRKRHAMKLTT